MVTDFGIGRVPIDCRDSHAIKEQMQSGLRFSTSVWPCSNATLILWVKSRTGEWPGCAPWGWSRGSWRWTAVVSEARPRTVRATGATRPQRPSACQVDSQLPSAEDDLTGTPEQSQRLVPYR